MSFGLEFAETIDMDVRQTVKLPEIFFRPM